MAEGTYDAAAIVDAACRSLPIGNSVSRVPVGQSQVILLGFNTSRSFIVLQNSGSPLYVKLGTGAALDNYSFRLSPNAYASIDKWGGVVSVVRATTIDDVIVTEAY